MVSFLRRLSYRNRTLFALDLGRFNYLMKILLTVAAGIVFAMPVHSSAASAEAATTSATLPALMPLTLRDAYKDHFYVGVAINRTIATGTAVQADNVNRTLERVEKDTSLVKEQFNQ